MNYARVGRRWKSFVRNRWTARITLTATLVVAALVRTDALPGTLDTSFGFDGKMLSPFMADGAAIAIDHLDRMVVAGTRKVNGHSLVQNFNSTADVALARLNNDGSFDNTFGTDGLAQFVDVNGFDDVPRAMVMDGAGRIVLGGSATNPASHEDFALIRYTDAGLLDVHYGASGIATTDFTHDGLSGSDQVRGLALDSQGRTVAAGVSNATVDAPFFALARYQIEQPNFSISPVNPLSVPVAGSASTTITVNSIDGFNSPVTVTVSGQPEGGALTPGFTASFDGFGDQAELTPPPFESASSVLRLTAGAAVTPGTYNLFITPDPDSADRSHAVFFTVKITTTAATVANVVTAFQAASAIDNPGVANALTTKLANAQAAADAGDVKSAGNTLSAFINQVNAQNGKHIAATATIDGVTFAPASVLIDDARDLIAHLKTNDAQNPIVGFVTTSTNGEIGGAVVSLLDPAGAVVATATTDATGFYYFANTNVLTPGTQYTVTVTGLPRGFTTSAPASQALNWSSAAVSLSPFVLTQ